MPIKVGFAMAVYGPIQHQTVASYVEMLRNTMEKKKDEIEIIPMWCFNGFICDARKLLIENAMKADCKYILFLDGDMIWPADLAIKLVATAETEKAPIVSGFYCFRNEPYLPLIYRWNGQDSDDFKPCFPRESGLLKCDATGMGCCLLRLDIFKDIEKPWFAINTDNCGTEDMYFFKQLKKKHPEMAGAIVDTSLTCGHIGHPQHIWPMKDRFNIKYIGGGPQVFADEYAKEHFEFCDIETGGKPQ
jgi:glycosyltransferase involved in cell wall biosynthesis